MRSIVIVVLLFANSIAFAGTRPGIKVVVKITEDTFIKKYRTRLPDVERMIADSVATFLEKQFPIFHFSSSVKYKDSLTMKLVRVAGVRPSYFGGNWTTQIAGLNVRKIGDEDIKAASNSHELYAFGGVTPFQNAATELDFVTKVSFHYRTKIFDVSEVMRQLQLRWITEGREEMKVTCSEMQWILAYTFGELHIGRESIFTIRQSHKLQGVVAPRKYLAIVFNEIDANQSIILRAMEPQEYRGVRGADLNELRHLDTRNLAGIEGIQIQNITQFELPFQLIQPDQSRKP